MSTQTRRELRLRHSLLVAQRLDRLERGSPVGWIKAEPDAYRRANDQPGKCPPEGKNQVNLQPKREQTPADHPKKNAKHAARLRNKNRFGQKLPHDVAAARPNRLAHTDFFCPFSYTYEHDVHDPNARRLQRDETDDEGTDAHHARHGSESALERIVGVNLEIVFLIRIEAARDSHRADPFVQCPIVKFR